MLIKALATVFRPYRRILELEQALEPFASLAHIAVDGRMWKSRIQHERIVDWFGPTDFHKALQAYPEATDPAE
jgi:hypothetical protein